MRRPRASASRRLALLAALAMLAPSAAVAGEAGNEAPPSSFRPIPHDRVVSVWAGLAGADSSEATLERGSVEREASEDFSAFLFAGGRLEYYPAPSARLGKHFGVGVDAVLFAGEADMVLTAGRGVEETSLWGGMVAPSLVFRMTGRTWEFFAGAGITVFWWTSLSGSNAVSDLGEETDAEVPIGPSIHAGFRRTARAGWFFSVEGRYQAGENDFDLSGAEKRLTLEWELFQVAAGSGYRF